MSKFRNLSKKTSTQLQLKSPMSDWTSVWLSQFLGKIKFYHQSTPRRIIDGEVAAVRCSQWTKYYFQHGNLRRNGADYCLSHMPAYYSLTQLKQKRHIWNWLAGARDLTSSAVFRSDIMQAFVSLDGTISFCRDQSKNWCRNGDRMPMFND